MDCSLPGFSVHGIFQARILEWVAISFSRRSSRPRDWTRVFHIAGRRFITWATIFFSFFFFNLYTWGQSVVEVMKTMVTSFKRSHAWTATLSGPNPASGHHRPTPHWRQLDTHGHVWVSLSWGHCSFSWVLVCRRFCLCPPRICFPSAV